MHSKSYPQFAREEDASGESRCHWKVSALHGGQVAFPDFETRDTYSIIFSALNLQRISLAVIADTLLAELKHCAMQKKGKKARFWCQVEVTVLEVEMADDCVSTSALRCFGLSFEFPQNLFITF